MLMHFYFSADSRHYFSAQLKLNLASLEILESVLGKGKVPTLML
jgi:hypothetical protein